jgi:hypothetical protein
MIIRKDLEIAELIKLGEKGITQDELEDVVSEYKEERERVDVRKSFEAMKEEYKKEKSKNNFEEGAGGFRRTK